MAIWQFSMFLANATLKGRTFKGTTLKVDLEKWRDIHSEKLVDSELLPLVEGMCSIESWDKDIRLFGEMDGNRIDVLYSAEYVSELSVRIDVRNLDKGFFERIVSFAINHKLQIVDIDQTKVISSDVQALSKAVAASNAQSFVRDAEAFLAQRGRIT